jgi:hypothetical protein
MADNRPNTRQEAYDALVKQLNSAKDRLNAAIKSGEVPNDSRAIINSKYYKDIGKIESQIRSTGTIGELGSGMVSAATGLLTGIPDLAIGGYNLYQEKRSPTLSELIAGKKGLFGEEALAAIKIVLLVCSKPVPLKNSKFFNVMYGSLNTTFGLTLSSKENCNKFPLLITLFVQPVILKFPSVAKSSK